MSHAAQREFVELISRHMSSYFSHTAVLEVGSLDINGSVRDFFDDCRYTGIDVAAGKGVDLVCQAQEYDAPDDSFDLIISCEAMEHNPHWVATFANMVRMSKPGGLVVMTCATTGRAEHGTPRTSPKSSPLTVGLGWNYYRNLTARDFRHRFDFNRVFDVHLFRVNWRSFDLYFCGIKHGVGALPQKQWSEFQRAIDDYVAKQNQPKVCVYRALVARWLGDGWYSFVRHIGNLLGSKLLLDIHP
jgi:SAM-dependent methyltransferase